MADVGTIYTRFQIREVERALQNLERIEETINRLENRTIRLRIDSSGLQQATTQMGGLRQAMQRLSTGVQQIGTGIKTGFAAIARPITSIIGVFNQGRTSIMRFSDQITHMGQMAAATAFRLQLLLAPMQIFLGITAKAVVELEHGLAIVGTQTEYSGAQLQEFFANARKAMQDTTEQWAVSQADLQEGFYTLISSLSIAPKSAEALLPILGKYAVLGEATAKDIANLGSILLSTFADPDLLTNQSRLNELMSTFDTMMSQVFLAMREGRGTFTEFVQQMGDFARIGEQVGASLPDLLAVFTVLTRTRPISEAATQVKRLMQSLIEKKTLEAFRDMGVATSEFAEGQENVGYWTSRSSLMTDKQAGSLTSLSSKLTHVKAQIDKVNQAMREWTSRTKESVKMGQREQLRVLEEQKAALEAQIAPLENLATSTEKVFIQTGEKVRREPFDILMDFFAKIATLDEPEALLAMEEAFPNIRAELGALEFKEFQQDILELSRSFDPMSESFKAAVKVIGEQADVVNSTIKSKLIRTFSTLINIGQDIETDFAPQIKGALDIIIERLRALRELPAEVRQNIAKLLFTLSALPPITLGVSVGLMGAGGLVNALATLLSPGILATAGGLFLIFREELGKLKTVLTGYDLSTLEGITTFLAEFAVATGMMDEEAVEGMFEQLQIAVDLDPSRIERLRDALKDIGTRAREGADYVKEWVKAFQDFFDDVQKREGLLGNLIEFFEGAAGFLSQVIPNLPGGDLLGGKAGKKTAIDVVVTGYIAKQVIDVLKGLWTAVMWIRAGVVNITGAVVSGGGPQAGGGTGGRGGILPGLFGTGMAGGQVVGQRGLFPRFFDWARYIGGPRILGDLAPALIPTGGALAALLATALAPWGRMNPLTPNAQSLQDMLEASRQQGFDPQAIPGLRDLIDEFYASKGDIEHQTEVLYEIRDVLIEQNKTLMDVIPEDPFGVPIAELQGAAQRMHEMFNRFTERAVAAQPGWQTLGARYAAIAGMATPAQMLALAGRAPGVPLTGRGEAREVNPLLAQLNTLLQQIVTSGVNLSQFALETLITEFMADDTSQERQQAIIDELNKAFLSAQRREGLLQRIANGVEGLSRGWQATAERYTAMARAYTGRTAYHTGGFIDLLQSEFVTSPLTTRMLEAAIGGPLTQGGLQQLALAGVTAQHNVTVGGNVGINLSASGMGDFQLSARQKDDLGWEITGLVAERLRKAFGG